MFTGYERFGAMDKAKAVFEDMKAAGLSAKAHGSSKIPNYLEQFGRKIARQVRKFLRGSFSRGLYVVY